MKLLFALLLVATLPAATVVNVACGGSTDSGSLGGARWTGAAIAGQPVPFNSMRSSSPLGAPFSYSFTLAPGKYTVTLQFIEPRADQTAGQRILGVAINGAAVITGLDLFTVAGALKPYTAASFAVTVTGLLKVDVSATAGNAILSGIRIDDVPVPAPSTSLWACEYDLSTGGAVDDVGGLFPGTFANVSCENMGSTSAVIHSLRCRSNTTGPTVDLKARGAGGVLRPMLTAPVPCTPDGFEGVPLPGASYAAGEALQFVFIIPVPTDPSVPLVKWILGTVTFGTANPVATLRECNGSGPGWDCAGLLWATIPLASGPLQLIGAAGTPPEIAPGTTWLEKR
jgi:hypothetical protein